MNKDKEMTIALQSVPGQNILKFIEEYILGGNVISMDGLAALIELRRTLVKIQKSD